MAPGPEYELDLEEEALELEPFLSYAGVGEFETPAAQNPSCKNILDIIRRQPQKFKRILLTAVLHPEPFFSNVAIPDPISPKGTVSMAVFQGLCKISPNDFADLLKAISVDFQRRNTAFRHQVEAERKLQSAMIETVNNVVFDEYSRARGRISQRLRPLLLDALRSKSADREQLGRNFGKMLPHKLVQRILHSEASEAHLVRLGQMLQRLAITFNKFDPTFK